MPSVDDVHNELLSARSKLDQIESELVNVENADRVTTQEREGT